MHRTTVYFSDDLRAGIRHQAKKMAVSEAEVIREAVRRLVEPVKRPRQGGIFEGGEPIAENVDHYLVGFGE